MSQRPAIHYTDTQIGLMWDRWQRGESLHQIAQLFDRHHSSVRRILAETGGIRPAKRHRSDGVLTLGEREEISRALVAGQSIRCVAARLGRAPSTISREIRRAGPLSSQLRRSIRMGSGPTPQALQIGPTPSPCALSSR